MSKIFAWLKALFTWHNAKAVAVTVERVAETAADVSTGQVGAAVQEAASAADAAKSLKVVPDAGKK